MGVPIPRLRRSGIDSLEPCRVRGYPSSLHGVKFSRASNRIPCGIGAPVTDRIGLTKIREKLRRLEVR